jgi:hypothetical protein
MLTFMAKLSILFIFSYSSSTQYNHELSNLFICVSSSSSGGGLWLVFFIVPPWRGNFSFQTLLLLCAAAGDLLSACHHTV